MGKGTRHSFRADGNTRVRVWQVQPFSCEASCMCEQDPKPSSSPKIVTTHRLGLRSNVVTEGRVHLMKCHHQHSDNP